MLDTIERSQAQFTCTLDPKLASLMGRIWDFKRMKAAMSDMQIDQQRCPLGKLDKRQITQGYRILAELQKLVSVAEIKETAVTMLTNQFYTMIPHDFGAKRPVMIDHISKVKEKSRLLDQLADIQLAQDFLLQSFVGAFSLSRPNSRTSIPSTSSTSSSGPRSRS